MHLPDRLHRRLSRQVELALLTRAASLSSARARFAALSAAIAAAETNLATLRDQLAAAHAHHGFTADTPVGRALTRHPAAAAILTRHGLATCQDCPVRHTETLAELARGHDLDLAAILAELNALGEAGVLEPEPGRPLARLSSSQ
jgi:hybrid cluster-associated redox disulfide protein